MTLVEFVKRTIAKTCLFLLGWETSIPLKDVEVAAKQPRLVVIFPHTSYCDFVMYLLYAMVHPEFRAIRVIVNPVVHQRYQYLMDAIGAISATRLEDRGKGFVQNTVDRFKGDERVKLMLSPEGTLKRSSWRSGYYHLARGLNCPVMVVGVDYHHHKMTVIPIVFYPPGEESQQFFESQLQEAMSTITPLYPTQSWTNEPARSIPTSKIGWAWWQIGICLMGLYRLYY